jgi:hypothetical protein
MFDSLTVKSPHEIRAERARRVGSRADREG